MRLYGWIGSWFLLVSEYCLFRKIEPFYSWFYCFAWWSYILLADNLLLKLRGSSLSTTRRRAVEHAGALGVDLAALRSLQPGAAQLGVRRRAGRTLAPLARIRRAFATVLPGIFITSDLVEHFLFGSRGGPFASEAEESSRAPDRPPSLVFLLLGLFLSVAPLLWPRYFFPAVWLGPIFLLDPLLEKMGLQSLARPNARATGAGYGACWPGGWSAA